MGKEIIIPFKERFEQPILDGKKVVTRRYRKYGNVDDWFVIKGRKFILTKIYREPLCFVTEEEARKEGCNDLEEFKNIWKKIHPRREWNPSDVPWVHRWD
jgi:hypothetical protein